MWEDITLPCLAKRHIVIRPCGDEMAALIPNAWGPIEGSDNSQIWDEFNASLSSPPEKVIHVTLYLARHLYIV